MHNRELCNPCKFPFFTGDQNNFHVIAAGCQERFEYVGTYCLYKNIDIIESLLGDMTEFRAITLSECQALCQKQRSYCGLVFYLSHGNRCFLQPSYNHGNTTSQEQIQCERENVTYAYLRFPCQGE